MVCGTVRNWYLRGTAGHPRVLGKLRGQDRFILEEYLCGILFHLRHGTSEGGNDLWACRTSLLGFNQCDRQLLVGLDSANRLCGS